ncbi:MAG: thioredoxin domain-containing protein [Flavobacterium sp.]|nr:thioredoxin domain-containing protein [Flavobacterium sp.]
MESEGFEDMFLSHPNYPSLYAVTDTLSMLNIENVAAQVPKDQLTALPDSFLAVISDDIVLVHRSTNEISIENEKQGKKRYNTADFLQQWSGIVVAIEPNEITKKNSLPILQNKYLWLGILLFILLLLVWGNLILPSFLTLLISSLGLILSIVIIDEKINKSEGVISKICSFSEQTSCDSVIKSDSSKLTKWLDFSDLPILFFGTSVLLLQLQPSAFSILNFLSVLALPLVGYSVWLQKVKLEKWCILCLGISLLLLIQSLFFILFTKDFYFDYKRLLQASLLVFPTWFFIKPILFRNKELIKENVTHLKFKRNYSIFSFLQKPVTDASTLNDLPSIIIGYKEALVTIDLIVSPSCGHCHTAFSQAMDLLQHYPEKIKVRVYFNLNIDNSDNPYLVVAKTVLQLNKDYPQMAELALQDWHKHKMSLPDWKTKWKVKHIDFEIEQTLKKSYEWCLKNEFNFTPIKIVNSNVFPTEYDLKELKYFISEITEKEEALPL